MRAVVAGTDTASQRLRASYGVLAADASDVVLVADEALCSQAANAFRAAVGKAGDPVRPVWLLKVGPQRYLVADGWRAAPHSERLYAVVFDENWIVKRILATS